MRMYDSTSPPRACDREQVTSLPTAWQAPAGMDSLKEAGELFSELSTSFAVDVNTSLLMTLFCVGVIVTWIAT